MHRIFLFFVFFLACSRQSSDNCQSVSFEYFVSTDPIDSSYSKRAKNVVVKVIDAKDNIFSDTTDTLGRFNIVGNICFPYQARIEKIDGSSYLQMNVSVSNANGCRACHYPGGQAGRYLYIQ
ncbi:MAG: hypothetical protein N2504_01680 [candidate division WOR-3 bacterium]|nr:hypothetical protein [candidate division WOR-3 bacterium]MCX7947281.1 hypothetical protein [candidate division WOR-3 bacterium]MDW8150162.1 hypothetical protein [candidate division WOR-3 bacterium]